MKKPPHFWQIEILDRFETIYRRTLPGHLSEAEIGSILQRLACNKLTPDEIISASQRKPKRTGLLEYQISHRPRSKRTHIWMTIFSDYMAAYWTAEEIASRPDIPLAT